MTSTIGITGAAGTAGKAYAAAFASAGHTVRACVRPGGEYRFDDRVEVWPVDLQDAAATGAALAGLDVVVIALAGRGPHAAEQEATITRAVSQAAATTGASHIVYTSVHRADEPTGVPHFEVKGPIEAELAELVPRLTVLRPTTFADALTAPWLRTGIEEQGVLVSPIGLHTPISYVATQDLARVAVAALEAPELQRRPVVVAGPSPLTYAELLPLLSELAGRQVEYRQIQHEDVLRSFGADLAAMTDLFNRDGFHAEPSQVLHDLDLVPAPVQQRLREAWQATPARGDVAAAKTPTR